MKLIKIQKDFFAIKVGKSIRIGNKEEAVHHMMEELDILPSEIQFAMDDLGGELNVADFGLNGTFIFSKKVALGEEPMDTIKEMAA